MTSADFWKDMDLPETSDIHKLESRFLDIVKKRIQKAAETYDETEVAAEETWLRAFHQNFFLAVLRWVGRETRKKKRPKNHPEAIKLKKKAKKVIQDLQNNIADFAIVYMHLGRYVTLLRDEIRQEESRLGASGTQDMKWTSDTGIAIRRYKKRKNKILADLKRFETIRPVLQDIDTQLEDMKAALSDIQGAETAGKTIRSFVSSLRTANYTRIKKIISDFENTKKKFGTDSSHFKTQKRKAKSLAADITKAVKSHEEDLKTTEGKFYLKPVELDMVTKSHDQEMKKIRSFLLKYHLPYMQYKINTLFHLKDKLLVVGSPDSLMTLYKKLIIGLAEPITDIKGVRQYESEVLERISYLLETQFKEVGVIQKRAEETVREFRKSASDIKKIQDELKNEPSGKTAATAQDQSEESATGAG